MKKPPKDLQEAVRDAFRNFMVEKGLTPSMAARALGVKRQSMHDYLKEENGSLPSVEVLYKACQEWKIKIVYRGWTLGVDELKPGVDGLKASGGDSSKPSSQAEFDFNRVAPADIGVRITSQSVNHLDLSLLIKRAS
jgi:DNA-binding XRE family transcriptional regulator